MKQVIILDKLSEGNRYRYVLWAAVPAARQSRYADASATSQFTGASAQESQDIKDGKVVEKVDTISVAAGVNLAAVQAELQSVWTAYQTFINNYNPWQRYGSSWDGASWTATNNL